MILTVAEIQARLGDPDREVRDIALDYFRDGLPHQLASPIESALESVARFGWSESFRDPWSRLPALRQTHESVRWFLAHPSVWSAHSPDDDDDLAAVFSHDERLRCVARHLCDIELDLLREFRDSIAALPYADDALRMKMDERLRLAEADPESLWAELCDIGTRSGADWLPEFWPRISLLESALGGDGARFGARVLGVLAATEVVPPLPDWMAVRLAGVLRLREAVPILVDRLNEVAQDDYEALEDFETALWRAGGDEVVPPLVAKYAAGSTVFRESTAVVLEQVRSATASAAALHLAEREADDHLRLWLLRAALRAPDDRAVETTRRDLLARNIDEEYLELRSNLLSLCRITGATFPEHQAWVEDSRHDRDRLRSLRMGRFTIDRPTVARPVEYEPDFDSGETYVGPLQAVASAGRNDSCPCGSGKKYKKCCLRTQ